MKNSHLITGATGFVGSALALELLQKTSDTILCLVRSRHGETSQARLLKTLHHLVDLYALPKTLHKDIDTRCFALEGDLTDNLTATTAHVKTQVKHFWHSAASLEYEERFAAEIYKINVDGTINALELAQKLGAEYFNHVSTAYVAGRNTGTIFERLTENETPNNTYEASKILSEKIVYKTMGLKTRIFRPSIVVGHSQTSGVLTFSGLYGFARRVMQFNGMMNRMKKGFLNTNRINMVVDDAIPLNFIPIDMVAQEIVAIGLSDTLLNFFHICNPDVLTARETVDTVFESVGVTPPLYAEDKTYFSDVDSKFNEKIDFYASYLRGFKAFSRENVTTILGERDLKHFAVDKSCILQHIHWYLQSLQAKRSVKMPVMR